jgi:hypothetical protein
MSDLSSAALVGAELVVLTHPNSRSIGLLIAGFIGGFLLLMRYANIGLVLAAAVAITAQNENWRQKLGWYAMGCAPIIVALAIWQFAAFGSPLSTGYQQVHSWPNGWVGPPSLFSLEFVFGQPLGRDGFNVGGVLTKLGLPNALAYVLELVGDAYVLLPGVGLVGLLALLSFFRQRGPLGVLGRFGLVALAANLLIYLPWWYQSGRFFIPAAVPVGLAAGIWVGRYVPVARRHIHLPSLGKPRTTIHSSAET